MLTITWNLRVAIRRVLRTTRPQTARSTGVAARASTGRSPVALIATPAYHWAVELCVQCAPSRPRLHNVLVLMNLWHAKKIAWMAVLPPQPPTS
jgi:hypothetical protein